MGKGKVVTDRVFAIKPSGREEAPPAPEPTLEQRIAWQAQRISAIERLIAKNEAKAREYEEIYAAAIRQYVDGYREEIQRLKIGPVGLANAEAGMLALLQELPEGRRKYRHGRVTFCITKARKSIEIANEDMDKAVKEVEALGEKIAGELVRTNVEKSVKKKEMLEFIEKRDAPEFENIKLRPGSDSLRRTYK